MPRAAHCACLIVDLCLLLRGKRITGMRSDEALAINGRVGSRHIGLFISADGAGDRRG